MLKELLSRYELLVFSNGEIELHPIVVVDNLNDCSSSIRQIIEIIDDVLLYLKENPNNRIHFAVTTAVNKVARLERVTPSTVYAKITRKLGISLEDFKKQLKICIDNKAPDNDVLVQTLYNSCVSRTKQADEAGVKNIVEKIRNFQF